MADFDKILEKLTNAGKDSGLHGAAFVAVSKTGKRARWLLSLYSCMANIDTGDTIYSGACGSRNVDGSSPMELSTLCWLASQGKIVTSVAAIQVVENGLIGLDDDCGRYVPALANKDILVGFEGDEDTTGKSFDAVTSIFTFKNPRKPILRKAKNPITLRLLLSHSAGFQYGKLFLVLRSGYKPILISYRLHESRIARISSLPR
jgi:CubicO group peptidase (beta-lactamase class C family)